MDKILLKKQGPVAYLTLNRVDVHNAFDDEFIELFIQHLDNISADNNLRVVLLLANGKHFSAGADLAWMKRMGQLSEEQNRADAQRLAELMYKLNYLNKPTIVMSKGSAFGGAVGLISCCDIALATHSAKFCLSEVKIGLSPAVISPFVLAAMGARACRRYFLSGEVFDAEHAKVLGLIHETFDDEEDMAEKAAQLSKHICDNGPAAVQASKTLIHTVAQGAAAEIRQYTVDLIARLRVSAEGQEGLSAFLEKRKASWSEPSHD
jgi:methylglutaconyl-CoA hydratase